MTKALLWLQANNPYYADIIIDNEVLRSLPENGSIANRLPQTGSNNHENDDENEIGDDVIRSTLVPSIPPTQREDAAIDKALDRMQNNLEPTL